MKKLSLIFQPTKILFKSIALPLAIFSIICTSEVFAQNFNNPDLNGTVAISGIPTSWTNVPYTDPISEASSANRATPDLTDATGPVLSGGIAAVPVSGPTCVTGVHGGSSVTSFFHEGIQQTVNGFTIGSPYMVDLYQAVVKQSNCLDQTGSWIVYMDNVLLGVTAISTSTLAYNNVNVVWDYRSFIFTATATSHTFKFLPHDNDNDHSISSSNTAGGLRMGIDNINIGSVLPVNLIDFSVECEGVQPKISWTTAFEEKNNFFTIEKSTDGMNWEELTKVAGTNNGHTESNYEIIIESIDREVTYYRLLQTDMDGTTTITRSISLEPCSDEEFVITAFPNPVESNLNISIYSESEQRTTIMVRDISGRLVISPANYKLQAGANLFEIDVANLKANIYIVELQLKGKTEVVKFVKL